MRTYGEDFVGWAEDTARAITEGRWNEIDRMALVDEVESLGRSAKRQLRSALRVLLTHLLKSTYQPELHTRSWDAAIRRERRNVQKFLDESPSLQAQLGKLFAEAYEDAVYQAEAETGLSLSSFPESSPWSLDEALEQE